MFHVETDSKENAQDQKLTIIKTIIKRSTIFELSS